MLEFDRRLGPLPGTINARRELVDATLQYLKGLSETARGDLELSREVARGYYRIADIQGAPAEMNLGEPRKAEATFVLAEYWITQVLEARPTDPLRPQPGSNDCRDRMFIAEARNGTRIGTGSWRSPTERIGPMVAFEGTERNSSSSTGREQAPQHGAATCQRAPL